MRTIIKCALTLAVALFATSLFAQGPAHKKDNRTPEQIAQSRTDRMDKALTLNDKQKKDIYQMYLKMGEQRKKAWSEPQATPEAKKEAMKKMFAEHDAQLKKILTADQYTKWQQLMKERRDKMKRHHGKMNPDQKCECPQNTDCNKECSKDCPKKGDCNKECPKKDGCKKECPRK